MKNIFRNRVAGLTMGTALGISRNGKRLRKLLSEQIDSSNITPRRSTHCRVTGRSPLVSSARGVSVALTALFLVLGSMPALAQTGGPGSLDTSFNSTGQVVSYFTIYPANGLDVLIDPQGRIVVGTATDDPLGRLNPPVGYKTLVARYNFNGTSLDLGFGDQNSDLGTVITDWGFFTDSYHAAIALDSVGRIVAVGSVQDLDCCGGGVVESDFAISRYTTQGIPDATFVGDVSADGKRRVGFDSDGDFGRAVAIDSSGRIIAAGLSNQDNFPLPGGDVDFALVRLLPNGDFDATFDGDGKVITDFGGRIEEVDQVLIDASGRIIAVGQSLVDDDSWRIAIARYNVDGSLDSTFSDNGKLFASFGLTNSSVEDAALDSAGRILIAGSTYDSVASDGIIAVARFNEDGSLDESFGTRGATLTDIQGNERAYGIALDSLGRIILAGTTIRRASDNSIAVTRYTPDGLLDTTFGLGGVVLTDLVVDGEVAQDPRANDVEIDSEDRILVAGIVHTLTNQDPPEGFSKLALVRYHNGSTSTGNVIQLVGTLRTAGAIDSDGIANALTQQLDAAEAYSESGDLASAEEVLDSFINLVNAQQRKKHIATTATIDGVTFDPAAVLVGHARSLITDLSTTQNP